jgi:hypothetical protein
VNWSGWRGAPLRRLRRVGKSEALPTLLDHDSDRWWARRKERLCPPYQPEFQTYSFAFSRRVSPEVCPEVSRHEIRGRGECRMRAAPAVPCAKWEKKTHTSIQVQRRHSDIPCAMALRITSSSPRRIGLFCLRRLRIWLIRARSGRQASEDLTPTTEASGPHDFTVRNIAVRQRAV